MDHILALRKTASSILKDLDGRHCPEQAAVKEILGIFMKLGSEGPV